MIEGCIAIFLLIYHSFSPVPVIAMRHEAHESCFSIASLYRRHDAKALFEGLNYYRPLDADAADSAPFDVSIKTLAKARYANTRPASPPPISCFSDAAARRSQGNCILRSAM